MKMRRKGYLNAVKAMAVLKIKDLPFDDRPREKLLLRGVQSLSDAELLAILLRTGLKGKSVVQVAQEILQEEGSLSTLASKSVESLTKYDGIGKDKAATLVAAFEIVRRVESNIQWYQKKRITEPKDVAEMFIPILRDEVQEKFVVICLNAANNILKYKAIFTGTLNSSVVHSREIFKFAIENNSANIILMHNHPSGNCEPSREDIAITKTIVEAGKIIDIKVFDHIILAGNNFSSFVERKLL